MDSSFVEAIGGLAVEAAKANVLDTDTPTVIITGRDGTQTIQSLEAFQGKRSRFRGALTTSALDDFVSYIEIHANGGVPGFVDVDSMTSKMLLQPGHRRVAGPCRLDRQPRLEAHGRLCGAAEGRWPEA